MACYNPESEEFQSVCRVMSGFSDDFYKEVSLNYYLYLIVSHLSLVPLHLQEHVSAAAYTLECNYFCFDAKRMKLANIRSVEKIRYTGMII
jgi:hypothetical protein